jgi:thiamine kinase-like enzyme
MDELFFSFESPNQSFTHWDLQPKNIIISDSWEIEWIIDFSDSRVWSCELDFCHILHQSESLCKKAIEIYLWKYDQWFFERIFFLSRRSVIFEIDNDDMYHNNFDKIYQSLINSNFLFS